MMECSQNPIGFKQLVFAVAQDCENLLEMGANSNRLFSHCFRKKKNQQLSITRKLLIFSVDQPGLEPGTSRL